MDNKFKRTKNRDNKYKDDADLFREESLRAIRRRKYFSQITFWGLMILAVIVLLAVYVAYFVDK